MPFHADTINEDLVRRLIAAQFPQWAHLPVSPAVPQGWDNRTFRLGTAMSVRLPSAAGYSLQTEKEHRWLPVLAPQLPLSIPVPLALGQPGEGFPWQWSVYRWLEGTPTSHACINDVSAFATTLAHFLSALQRIDASDGPLAGPHSAFRGGPLSTYDAETRQAIATLADEINPAAATAVWEAAVTTHWHGPPVWFHGDVAVGNLLLSDGNLDAVIDFGCAGVGDPACDLVIAWTLLTGASRATFRAALPLDAATWFRGRGWALWKALITLAEYRTSNLAKADEARRVLREIFADMSAMPE
jgi:aminoglycoside phosphotransferase (APT) family kinase protein